MYVYHSIYFQNMYSSKYYSPINPLLALIWLNILVWRPSKTKIICLFYSQLLFRGGNSVLAKMPHFLARETTSTLSVRHSFCSSYITGSSLSAYHSTRWKWFITSLFFLCWMISQWFNMVIKSLKVKSCPPPFSRHPNNQTTLGRQYFFLVRKEEEKGKNAK